MAGAVGQAIQNTSVYETPWKSYAPYTGEGLGAPGTTARYSWAPNGQGGVNYFLGNAPISNNQYGSATGEDYGKIEGWVGDWTNANTPAADIVGAAGGGTALNYGRFGSAAGVQAQKNSILDSINNKLGQNVRDYRYGVEDFGTASRRTQRAIDNKGTQNELARMQGRGSILTRVGDQVKSSGVMLGQRNAGNSSAAQALANAYGTLGNRDVQKVEQGYNVNNQAVNAEQQDFNEQRVTQAKRLEESKSTIINNIVEEARLSLEALDAEIAGASLPDRIAIEQEKQNIRNNATSQLQQLDAQLGEARNMQGTNINQRRSAANALNMAGNAADQPFEITPEANMQLQAQAPSAPAGGNLPIFTLPRKRV